MEEAQLQKRFLELGKRAERENSYIYTNFLNSMEQNAFLQIAGKLGGMPYRLFGGDESCERKLLSFGGEEVFGYVEEFPIACMRIAPANEKFAEALTHRDYLGALMHLGIERDVLGDIRMDGHNAYLFCLLHMEQFLKENLVKIKNTSVRVSAVSELPKAAALSFEEEKVQVASERLDAVIAKLYRLSRGESTMLFAAGKVFVNDKLMENSSYSVRAGDIISLRGYGKFRYEGVTGTSKKGKLIVLLRKYA